jgi:hypothetical protein
MGNWRKKGVTVNGRPGFLMHACMPCRMQGDIVDLHSWISLGSHHQGYIILESSKLVYGWHGWADGKKGY